MNPTETPWKLRRWSLELEVRPFLERLFATRAQVQSAFLAVGQFWADEADDAVHSLCVISTARTPAWPHHCEALPTENCSYCTQGMDTWLSWDGNGRAIRGWQALCAEGASQDDPPGLAYTPVVLARRTATGVSFDDVSVVLRPWLDLPSTALPSWKQNAVPSVPEVVPRDEALELPFLEAIERAPADDGPRLVFADWLQQRQDPLGTFISLSLSTRSAEIEARRLQLLHTHGEAWLGELAACVPAATTDFSRGLLTGATVVLSEATVPLMGARAWRTVEQLTFAPTSLVRFSPELRALRSVVGLSAEAVLDLPASVTEVACGPAAFSTLPAHVTKRTLVLGVDERAAGLERALALSRWDGVEAFDLALEPVREEGAEALHADIEVLVARVLRLQGPRVSVGGWATRRTGWWLERTDPASARLRFEGFACFHEPQAREALLRAARQAGITTLTLVESGWWAPSVDEVEHLTRSGFEVRLGELQPALPPPSFDSPRQRVETPVHTVQVSVLPRDWPPLPAPLVRFGPWVLAALLGWGLLKACG